MILEVENNESKKMQLREAFHFTLSKNVWFINKVAFSAFLTYLLRNFSKYKISTLNCLKVQLVTQSVIILFLKE